MANAQTDTLVLKDNAGNYFVLPQEAVERGRVPQEHKAEVERLIAEQHDVQGHVIPLAIFGCIGAAVGAAVGIGFGESLGQAIDWQSYRP